jgi:hypothetical protein
MARTKILHTRGSSAPRWMGLVPFISTSYVSESEAPLEHSNLLHRICRERSRKRRGVSALAGFHP